MTTALQFALTVEDDWPPVGSESLPFKEQSGGYEALVPPLFVKDLSVGDVIRVTGREEGFITSWMHLLRSERSTIWLLRIGDTDEIPSFMEAVRAVGCNTTGLEEFGCYAVDVPAHVPIATVETLIEALDPNKVAVAFPSIRHADVG